MLTIDQAIQRIQRRNPYDPILGEDLHADSVVLAELERLRGRYEQMERALQFYAAESTYEESAIIDKYDGAFPITEDAGNLARAALSREGR
ncbi:MAG: hypothetical protein E6Q97_19215 [Desulfurellales bacterium]|nr:MAG: hypothetical protein E6Q97_19215 [Desulfurellales bacterium]